MANPAVGRWSRRFTGTSAWFLVAASVARLAGAPGYAAVLTRVLVVK